MVRLLAVGLAWALSMSAAHAAIYKWVDEQGVTQYSEKPPPGRKANEVRRPRSTGIARCAACELVDHQHLAAEGSRVQTAARGKGRGAHAARGR
jgi:hypothetical protein